MIVITIGITLVLHQPIIPVGPHQKAINLSMTHVRQVGVFQMVEATVYGLRHVVQVQSSTTPTTAPTKAWIFPASSVLPLPSGTLLRVFATPSMAVSTMSAAAAAIGLRRLASTAASSATTRTT